MTDPRRSDLTAAQFRELMNAWPTFAAQAITVLEVAEDWSRVEVRLDLTEANANWFGTAFGGSLFSMIDPFLPIMLSQRLGAGHVVWDRLVEIDFRRPGTGPVTAVVEVGDDVVEEVRVATAGGERLLRWFEVALTLEDGTVVAVQRRQIYVRRRRPDA